MELHFRRLHAPSSAIGCGAKPVSRAVLILGSIPRIVIPIARSLHRHGVPVDFASFPSTPRIPSRAISESRTVTRNQVEVFAA
jgi:hypothetical protein